MTQPLPFLYKLGHQPRLGLTELTAFGCKELLPEGQWARSDTSVPVSKTGSLVFRARVLGEIPIKQPQSILIAEITSALNQLQDGAIKKLGIVTQSKIPAKMLIGLAKEAGYKKINVISDLPNYGHWKSCKQWLLILGISKSIVIAWIDEYFDQQTWGQLDTFLPEADMRRGLINLKLARTMLNLTPQKIIWDPFCGQGRIAVAGLDRKSQFYLSDIDLDCLDQAENNIQSATNFYQAKMGFKNSKLAQTQTPFALDAALLDQARIPESTLTNTAIVTEGYLGQRYSRLPEEASLQKEFQFQEQLWRKIIKKSQELAIPELIFCLPFYQTPQKRILPEFYKKLITGTNYYFAFSNDYLLYARKDSLVGHFIIYLRDKKRPS